MKSVLRFVNKFLSFPPTVGCCSTVLRGVVSRQDGLIARGIQPDGKARWSLVGGKIGRAPLTASYRPSLRFPQEASVSSRLYCRAYTAITFLRGAGRCLRAQVYACVVNAISSFLILLRVFLSRGKKKGCNFSFLFLLINGRRGEWRGGCLLSFSIRLIRMISFTVSVAWLGDFVIVVVYE